MPKYNYDTSVIARRIHGLMIRAGYEIDQIELADIIDDVRINTTINGASTLNISVTDPEWRLLDSGFLNAKGTGKLPRIDINYPKLSNFWWRLARIEVGTGPSSNVTLVCDARPVVQLRDIEGVKSAERSNTTRAQFIKSITADELRHTHPKPIFVSPELAVVQAVAGSGAPGTDIGGPGGKDSVLWVGDSLGVGTFQYIDEVVGDGVVQSDSQPSRKSGQGFDVLKDKIKDKHKVVVFDLGTNDDPSNPGAVRANLDAAFDLIQEDKDGQPISRLMVVATVNHGNLNVTALNDTIEDFASQGGVTLVDWAKEDAYLTADKTHATAAGYKRRAKLFGDAMTAATPAFAAANGIGPTPLRPIDPDTNLGFDASGNALGTPEAKEQQDAEDNVAKNQGITPTEAKDLTIKSAKMDDEQRRNANTILDQALIECKHVSTKVATLATEALVCANIGESEYRKEALNDKGPNPSMAHGIFQLIPSTEASIKIAYDNLPKLTTYYMQTGFYKYGGAIKLAKDNPSMSPGTIASRVEGSDQGGSFYDTYITEARAIIAAYGGVPSGQSGNSSGSVSASYQFTRGTPEHPDENSWDAAIRNADDVDGWVLFAMSNRFYFFSEERLIRQRPILTISRLDERVIDIRGSVDNTNKATDLSVQILADPLDFHAGEVIRIKHAGPFSTGRWDGRWIIEDTDSSPHNPVVDMTLKLPEKKGLEPASEVSITDTDDPSDTGSGSTDLKKAAKKGAKALVDAIVSIAQEAGGNDVYVGSDYRRDSTTTSGNVSDHSSNDADRAARDIGKQGVDLLVGPPSPELDKAIVAIGEALGKDYGDGTSGPFQNADNIQFEGFRIQLIWRTPQWGGHMGHIHAGAKKT